MAATVATTPTANSTTAAAAATSTTKTRIHIRIHSRQICPPSLSPYSPPSLSLPPSSIPFTDPRHPQSLAVSKSASAPLSHPLPHPLRFPPCPLRPLYLPLPLPSPSSRLLKLKHALLRFKKKTGYGRTDRRTDGWTNGWTNGLMDRQRYEDAYKNLKQLL